jgi:hypothetical protein
MLVGRQFPTVCQRLAFIRDPLAFIRQALAPGGCRLALVRQALAPQGEPLTLSGKLPSLLGDVLAVGSNSSASRAIRTTSFDACAGFPDLAGCVATSSDRSPSACIRTGASSTELKRTRRKLAGVEPRPSARRGFCGKL